MLDRLLKKITTRRSLVAGSTSIALSLASAGTWRLAKAQESSTPTVGTPTPSIGGIRPTGTGDVPSTGAGRPGPANVVQNRVSVELVAPVGLAIASAGVDAGIEPLRVVDGAMQDPSGPWEVAWYENLGTLASISNVVMAGHIDYWNVGPSVFYNLASVQPGEEIVVSGDDGRAYPYTVEWVRLFDSTSMPLDEVIGSTGQQSLTLITCGGAFDYVNGQYLQRTVVRANRTGPGQAASA